MGFVSKAWGQEETIDLPAGTIYVPVGFDDNDDVVVVVDGYLPDTCYRLRPAEIKISFSNRTVLVQPKAVRLPSSCRGVIVPYSTVVHLGTFPEGTYSVAAKDADTKETLKVERASIGQIDDYLYAPIDSVRVIPEANGSLRALLRGRFTNTCLRIDTIKVINSGKVLEVLPTMKQLSAQESGAICVAKEKSYEVSVALPKLNVGRYLLHVRTLNGQSENEVFTVAQPMP
jgi:hypothetical protein